jgi:hypothetical protein
MACMGWLRLDERRDKFGSWEHVHGWRLEHCGHPTALHPWMLYDPFGKTVLAPNGRAWNTLTSAMNYVKEHDEHSTETRKASAVAV